VKTDMLLLTLMIKIRPLETNSNRCPVIKDFFLHNSNLHTNYQSYKNFGNIMNNCQSYLNSCSW
jgi:hypothetical protein